MDPNLKPEDRIGCTGEALSDLQWSVILAPEETDASRNLRSLASDAIKRMREGKSDRKLLESDSERFISPSVFSNPSTGQITWVLTDMLLGLNAGIMNQKYTDFLCPQLIPDSWLYLWNNQWLEDRSLTLSCF